VKSRLVKIIVDSYLIRETAFDCRSETEAWTQAEKSAAEFGAGARVA